MLNVSQNAFINLVFICVFGAGCQHPEGSSPRVIGGSLPESGELAEVLRIQIGAQECSATKIGRKLLLTAAHCLSNLEEGTALFAAVPTELVGHFISVQSGSNSTLNTIATLAVHQSYLDLSSAVLNDPTLQGEAIITAYSKAFDLAVIGTQHEIDAPTATLHTEVLQTNDKVILAGYGCDNYNNSGSGILRSAPMMVSKVLKGVVVLGEDVGRTAGACNGDSGGPVFKILESGKRVQVGVITFVGGRPSDAEATVLSTSVTRVDTTANGGVWLSTFLTEN